MRCRGRGRTVRPSRWRSDPWRPERRFCAYPRTGRARIFTRLRTCSNVSTRRTRENGEDCCRNEEPDAQTGGDQHDETDAAGEMDRGVMRLLREQENIDREQRAVWVEQLFPVPHIAVFRGRPRCEADDDRVLRELGRLKAEQPARRRPCRRADAGMSTRISRKTLIAIAGWSDIFSRDSPTCSAGTWQSGRPPPLELSCDEVGRAALRVQRVRVARGEQRDQADEQAAAALRTWSASRSCAAFARVAAALPDALRTPGGRTAAASAGARDAAPDRLRRPVRAVPLSAAARAARLSC